MQFNSIREYFYRFYSTLLLIMMLPILAFIIVYLQPVERPTELNEEPGLFFVFGFFVVTFLVATFIYVAKKIKSTRNRQGLATKLDKYFELTIVRYSALALSGVVLAAGFFFLRNDFFTGTFIGHLLLFAYLWPTAKTACRDLRLKGAEYEMVFYKKDKL